MTARPLVLLSGVGPGPGLDTAPLRLQLGEAGQEGSLTLEGGQVRAHGRGCACGCVRGAGYELMCCWLHFRPGSVPLFLESSVGSSSWVDADPLFNTDGCLQGAGLCVPACAGRNTNKGGWLAIDQAACHCHCWDTCWTCLQVMIRRYCH